MELNGRIAELITETVIWLTTPVQSNPAARANCPAGRPPFCRATCSLAVAKRPVCPSRRSSQGGERGEGGRENGTKGHQAGLVLGLGDDGRKPTMQRSTRLQLRLRPRTRLSLSLFLLFPSRRLGVVRRLRYDRRLPLAPATVPARAFQSLPRTKTKTLRRAR